MKFFVLLATAFAARPECSKTVPDGMFRTMLHPDRYLIVEAKKTFSTSSLEMSIVGKPAPVDPYDYDEEIRWEDFSPMLKKTVEYSLRPDCTLILDEANRESLAEIIRAVHEITAYYLEGGLTYNLEEENLMLGGWFPIVRVN